MKDDYPTYYPRTPRAAQSLWIWAGLLFAAFVAGLFLGSTADAETTTGPLEPASGTWRAYRGSGFTTFVCSANSEAAVMACAAADAERRATTTRYQLRYPNRYILITYVIPAPVPPPQTGWTHCANQGELCAFTGTRRLRYGAGDIWAEYELAAVDGGWVCDNRRGNPVVGVTKTCQLFGDLPAPVDPPPVGTGQATVRWEPPAGDITGYRIVYGRAPGELVHSVEVLSPAARSYIVTELAAGTWYFAVRATAPDAVSDLSNVASRTVP